MRRTLFIVLSAIIGALFFSPYICANANAGYQVTAVPDWAAAHKIMADPSPLAGQSVRYHLVDKQVYFDGDTPVYFNHYLETPLNVQGVEYTSKIEIEFSPDYEQLFLHAVTVERDGKTLDKLKTATVKLLNRESELENDIYNGFVTAVLILKDIRPGDRVEQSYSIKGRNPIFGERFFHGFRGGWSVPVDHVRYRMVVPTNRPMRSKVFMDEQPVETVLLKDRIVYKWEKDDLPAYVYEDDKPEWYVPHPYVQFTEYGNWAEVKAWAEPLYEMPGKLDPELLNIIAKIKNHNLETEKRVIETLKYVQSNIRYLGLELGKNSHLPRHPNDVFRRRFGDCKDKSVLLVSMLKKMGVAAYPALVSTYKGKQMAADLPSPSSFNHVIVMVQLEDRCYWLDPTNAFQEGTKLDDLGYEDLGFALAVGHELNTLTEMSEGMNDVSEISVEERYLSADYFSPVELFVTSTYTKAEADYQRRRFLNNAITEISRDYENYYARSYGKVKVLNPLHYKDDKAGNRFYTYEHYLVDSFWRHENEKAVFEVYASTINQYSRAPQVVLRKSPLNLYNPIRVSHTIRVQYPETFEPNDEPVAVRENEYIKYKYKAYQSPRELELSHVFERRGDSVPTENVTRHVALLDSINDFLGYEGWIDVEDSGEGVLVMKRMIDRINQLRLDDK